MCIIFCCKGHGSSCEACLLISYQDGKYDCLRCLMLQIEFTENLLKNNPGNIVALEWNTECVQARQLHFAQAACSATVHRVCDAFDRFSGLGEDSALKKAYVLPISPPASLIPSATLTPSHADGFASQPAFSSCLPKTVSIEAFLAPADVPQASGTLDFAHGCPSQPAQEPFAHVPFAQEPFTQEYLAQDHYDLAGILAEFPLVTPLGHACSSTSAVNGGSPKMTSSEAIYTSADVISAFVTSDLAYGNHSQLAQEPFAQDHFDLAEILTEFPPSTPSANACSSLAAVTMGRSHQSALSLYQCSDSAGAYLNDLAPTAHEADHPAQLAWLDDESLALFGTVSGSTNSSTSESSSQCAAPEDILWRTAMSLFGRSGSPAPSSHLISSFTDTQVASLNSIPPCSIAQVDKDACPSSNSPKKKRKPRKRTASLRPPVSPRKPLREPRLLKRTSYRRCEGHAGITTISQDILDACDKCRVRSTTSALIQKLKNNKGPAPVPNSDGSSDDYLLGETQNTSGSETQRFTETVTLNFRRDKEKEVRDMLSNGNAGRNRMEELVQFERVQLLYDLIKKHGVPTGAWLAK
ncbi:hypothetical protein NliqN6_2999 [Naganishia liquefaciens]|uniref:Uncharacterized protein n=1 Tax=Naganishia liquefaciens TaxID=104408 RepID=A0A8H3TSY5_9TREE|nr:hypothetical protein NliqN6_2999 [Naganishia liquefaciens]